MSAAQAHTLAAYVVRVTTDNVRMDRVRCDGCAHYASRTGTRYDLAMYDGYGFCMASQTGGFNQGNSPPTYATSGSLLVRADHACNAWTPKAGQ